MAGYIFALNNIEALSRMIENGIYSTNLSEPKYIKSQKKYQWGSHHEATFGDYFSMKEGDNVYFFIKRKIYGVGELISIDNESAILNYPDALNPSLKEYKDISNYILYNNNKSIDNRLICIFKPSPYFFKQGIDMDDALLSNPDSFRMLRAFWKLSFVKVDDKENIALRNIIIKRNKRFLNELNNNKNIFPYKTKKINLIKDKADENYKISDAEIINSASDVDDKEYLRHEMAIEASLIYNLTRKDESTNDIFGEWDYISHQVIASPFKAIDYMDKMDIFGYKYIPEFNIISDYLIIEIKKDSATIETVDQVIKYVDWVNQEYTHKDYSMISAYIVAYDIPEDVIEYTEEIAIRNFTKGTRPTVSEVWTNLKLVEYKRDKDKIQYNIIYPVKV